MSPTTSLRCLEPAAFQTFRSLRSAAVDAVAGQLSDRLACHAEAIDVPPWDSVRGELTALLDFMEPSLEFGVLQPMSDYLAWSARRSGARALAADDLAPTLHSLAEYFAQAMDGSHGAQVADVLGAALAVFVRSPARPDDGPTQGNAGPDVAAFCAALVGARQDDALRIMNACLDGGQALLDFELNVLQPALYAIGRRWQDGTLSVAVEHGASGIARTVMAAGLVRSSARAPNNRTVLLACVEGNQHDLGLNVVADAFRLAGWRVHCLGAGVPTPDLVEYALNLGPQVLGLSVAFAHQLRLVRSVAAGIGASAGCEAPVLIVGGAAAVRHERLVRGLGADMVATDAAHALAMTAGLAA